ncbi:MBL fold metallo-hydrolase [Clostridium sp. JS66]|uniref:MBL fold metallo-hydrolase n=1 Tax=Clostridium sp. JS66 TaxID=3064705 RepID=UPI00298E5A45|nr:MBL fold metallo-hydrolase [Clostridium sp. JS66]WPC41278.1 MBL fold metallo-hydrolase [Clostridium sp. JS66]
MSIKIKRIPAGIYAANCYIVIDQETKDCIVMDPGGDEEDLIKIIKGENVQVKYILLTHGHLDHTGAAVSLKKEFKAPICINNEDYKMISKGASMYGDIDNNVDQFIKEGDIFKVGSMEIKCIHTPGHTPGSLCFLMGDSIFTGDTLFAGSIGRTDLEAGDFNAIVKNIKEKLMILDDEIEVLPGHGPESTIGREKVHNPFL